MLDLCGNIEIPRFFVLSISQLRDRNDLAMNNWCTVVIVLLLCLPVTVAGASIVPADGDVNVGILRMSVQHHDFVAPSSQTSFIVEADYAVHDEANIKSILFSGTLNHLGPELWHSSPFSVIGPALGDAIWTVNLTSPPNNGPWQFTAIAYYQNVGAYNPNDPSVQNNATAPNSWFFYNDTDNGPSYVEFTVRVSNPAQLLVDMGVTDVLVKAGDSSGKTASDGKAAFQVNVGQNVTVDVPSIVSLENSTQLVFQQWKDGKNSTDRTVLMGGDMKLIGVYKRQYLLQLESGVPGYPQSTWHDPGSVVMLQANSSIPMSWPLGALGFRYLFKSWILPNQVRSQATQINATVDMPMNITAEYAVDYRPLVLPGILAAGVGGAIILALMRRRFPAETNPPEASVTEAGDRNTDEEEPNTDTKNLTCANCGQTTETEWVYCTRCGKALST